MSRQTPLGLAAIFGMRWSTARWKSSLSITPRPRASAGFMATGKFRPKHVSGFEQIFERRQRTRLAWFRRVNVGVARRAKRAVHGGVFVKEREEHDDAFHDGGLDLQIEPRPRVVEPALNRLEAVTTVRANGGRPRANVERDVMPGEVRFELRIVRMSHVRLAKRHPQRPRRLPHLPLVLFAADREDVRRVVELRFQGSDVLANRARLR